MKKTREYQASQILKKKLLKKFLWLSRTNTFVKWSIMVLLTAGIIYFSLINSGAILDKSTNGGTGDWAQVLFAKPAFYWPLIVAFVYMLGVFIESILSWEAKRRQHRGIQSAGFANLDLVVKRTKIRIVAHAVMIIIVVALFAVWFHKINSVYPHTGRIFFDGDLAKVADLSIKADNPDFGKTINISHYSLRVFAALFVSMTVILLVLSITYIIVAVILLIKSRQNIIMYNQIKGIAIDSLLEQVPGAK